MSFRLLRTSGRWATGITAATAAAATTTTLYWNANSSSKAEENLFVPSLQATVRLVRLAGTCAMMWSDYQLMPLVASLHQWRRRWKRSTHPDNDTQHQQKEQEGKLRKHWEDQCDMRQNELADAQEVYTTNSNNNKHTTIEERVLAKRHEKQIMQQAAERLAEAEEQLSLLSNNIEDGGAGGRNIRKAAHQQAADRLLKLCQTNGGVYIKVGQHLANLDYLIPTEYITTLSALYDNNPVTPFPDVCRVIQQDLGAHPLELFATFDPVPIASASLAQVHVATTRQGHKLAVKVQHCGLRETSRGDLLNLVTAVRLAERWIPDFSLGWLADEIAPHLPKELDFVNEGRNAEKAQANWQSFQNNYFTTGSRLRCVIPKIFWELSSPRVLTMAFEEGFKATDVARIDEAGLNRHDVSTLIASVFASQIFHSGHVHCDPHEANVLLRQENGKPVLVLVDHGLYQTLDIEFRRHYARLWKSLMLADLKGIANACHGLGIENDSAYRLFAGILLARPFDELVERSRNGGSLGRGGNGNGNPESSRSDQAIIQGYAQRFLPNIISLLSVVPRPMLLLLKMNDCLRHVDGALGSPANTLIVTGRFAAGFLYQDSLCQLRKNKQHQSPFSFLGWLFYGIDRWRLWWDHVRLLSRISLYELGLWIQTMR